MLDEKLDKLFSSISSIELIPTEGCNMRCTYCYQHRNSNKVINNKVLDKLLLILDKYKNIDHITLFGGEPIQRHTVKRIKKVLDNWSGTVSIVTNGYDNSEDVMNFYREYKDRISSVQISLDGIDENNDNRVNIYGHSTYKQVVENMYKISEIMKGKVNIHSVLTNDSMKDFPRFFYQLQEWYDKRIINNYRFAMDHNESFMYDKELLQNVYRLIIHDFIDGRIPQTMFRRQLELTNYPNVTKIQCGIIRKFVTVLPNGNLLSCHFYIGGEDNQLLGDIMTETSSTFFDKIISDFTSEKESISSRGYNCEECEARPICHRCPAGSYRHYNDINVQLKNMCEYNLSVLEVLKEVYPDLNIFARPTVKEIDDIINEINEITKTNNLNNERYEELKHILELKGWWNRNATKRN